jgi:hypothetical protein
VQRDHDRVVGGGVDVKAADYAEPAPGDVEADLSVTLVERERGRADAVGVGRGIALHLGLQRAAAVGLLCRHGGGDGVHPAEMRTMVKPDLA